MTMTTKCYATQDHDDGEIRENAAINAFATIEEAKAYILAPFDIDEHARHGERVNVVSAGYGDCWIKASSGDVSDRLCEPFAAGDLVIQKPGSHPGGNLVWVTPRPDVLVAQVVSDDIS